MKSATKAEFVFLTATVVVLLGINHGYGPHARAAAASKAKEAIRAEDTKVLCSASAAYTEDQGKAPQSLNDLVQSGYLKAIPKDFPTLKDCVSVASPDSI